MSLICLVFDFVDISHLPSSRHEFAGMDRSPAMQRFGSSKNGVVAVAFPNSIAKVPASCANTIFDHEFVVGSPRVRWHLSFNKAGNSGMSIRKYINT